jgi:hypothetical protein
VIDVDLRIGGDSGWIGGRQGRCAIGGLSAPSGSKRYTTNSLEKERVITWLRAQLGNAFVFSS